MMTMERTRTATRLTGIGVVPLALAVATPLAARAQDARVEWSAEMAEGRTLDVRGISGSIVAAAAPDARARVVATKRGDRDDFHAVHVVVEENGGDIIVCAVYHRVEPETCDHREDERRDARGDRSLDVSVDYEVRVPAGVRFEGSMVSGGVRAEDLRSDVRARAVSGDIVVSTAGVGWGRTVSGDIEIRMGSADFGDLDFSTVSGDIALHLPADVGAEVRFESLSGDFETDFPIQVGRQRGRWVGSELEGRLGAGGPTLRFKTVSGDVRLRRAG